MFTHQDCRVRIMEHIPRQMRNLFNDLLGNIGMPLRGNEHAETLRGEQSRHEAPSLRGAPRALHNPWVSGHAQELVKDRPCCVPLFLLTQLTTNQCSTLSLPDAHRLAS